jgi:hypothetical protein
MCGVLQDFISVWNMSPEAAVQQSILDELMSVRQQFFIRDNAPTDFQVLDITPSTDCIHYLAFGDLLPGDMRQRIAGRTMHASVQRQLAHQKEAAKEPTRALPVSSSLLCSPPALQLHRTEQPVHSSEEPSSPPHESLAPSDPSAACHGSDVSRAEPLQSSSSSHLPDGAYNGPLQFPWALQAPLMFVGAAAICWMWSVFSHLFS